MAEPNRCAWAKSEIMVRYHDEEWGVPLHEDQKLFEFICLEGAQAGLSWETILKKRENYRKAFDDFRPEVIAKYNQKKVEQLLGDAGIVRNRLKIASFIQNAKAFLDVQKEFGSFDKYIWQFAPRKPGKTPRISTPNSSVCVPLKTVLAVPFMPGRRSSSGNISGPLGLTVATGF